MTNQYKDIGLTEYSNQQALNALKLKTQFIKDSCYTRFHLSTAIEKKPDEALNFLCLKKRSITSHPPVLIWDILDHECCARRLMGLLISLIKNIL
jgi:hypothetical protein